MTLVRGESGRIWFFSVDEQEGRRGSFHSPAQALTDLSVVGEAVGGSPRGL
jgi:hypothetical protein